MKFAYVYSALWEENFEIVPTQQVGSSQPETLVAYDVCEPLLSSEYPEYEYIVALHYEDDDDEWTTNYALVDWDAYVWLRDNYRAY